VGSCDQVETRNGQTGAAVMSGFSQSHGELLNLPATGDAKTDATEARTASQPPGLQPGLQTAGRASVRLLRLEGRLAVRPSRAKAAHAQLS